VSVCESKRVKAVRHWCRSAREISITVMSQYQKCCFRPITSNDKA